MKLLEYSLPLGSETAKSSSRIFSSELLRCPRSTPYPSSLSHEAVAVVPLPVAFIIRVENLIQPVELRFLLFVIPSSELQLFRFLGSSSNLPTDLTCDFCRLGKRLHDSEPIGKLHAVEDPMYRVPFRVLGKEVVLRAEDERMFSLGLGLQDDGDRELTC